MSTSAQQVEAQAPNSQSGVVVKSNDFVKAKLDWTTVEHRIILTMIAQLRKKDSEFEYQRVRLKKIIERSGSKSNDLYSRAEEICDKLLDQKVKIRDETESGERQYRGYNLMSACKYVEGSGAIRAKFNPDMRPFLLELKRRFTMYRLQFVMRLSSPYAIRLYEIIKMRQDLRFVEMTIEELRETLSVEHKYDRFTDLKKHILEPVRKELKKKCDVYFTYRVRRKGRTPVGINFMIHRNEDVQPTVEELPDEEEQAEEIAGRRKNDSEKDSQTPPSSSEEQPSLFSGSNGSDPDLDATALFQQDLTQDELSEVTDKELADLHDKAREIAEENNPNRSESILVIETYKAMKRNWRNRSE
jgi:plasmid replication initiation protein